MKKKPQTPDQLAKKLLKAIEDVRGVLTPERLERRVDAAIANITQVLTPEQLKMKADGAAGHIGAVVGTKREPPKPKPLVLPPSIEANQRLNNLLEGKDLELRVGAPDAENGNAVHRYEVLKKSTGETVSVIQFQAGPTRDGVNGVTPEIVIACVADHLRGFQLGPLGCRENHMVITVLDGMAMGELVKRRLRRRTAGVEGTRQNFDSANLPPGSVP